ncbi:M56 family metallopeptidase [uncultured Schumannella sp.]|uniref:M56 family metallopeptidase n=1 Tax=uncultured Schumannella sp. TaxID=1195956 RepID=UPI0025EFBB9D|nr:M56 family metallopeptidase [uncultured Schumannella sp.]
MFGALALALALLALALAVPVPIALARAAWPSRAPVRALLLWQAIGLAGGLSMIGAFAALGYGILPASRLGAGIAFGAALVLAGYLLGHLVATIVIVARQRRRHHALLDLLTSPHPTRAQTRVLDDAAPVAYCLPRGVGSLTVLSQGLLDRLSPDELSAVIAHERAHVEQRHDLLLLAFRAWRSALPWFPIAVRAEAEVAVLVEILADNRARQSTSDEVLARAILTVADARGDGIIDLESRRRSGRSADRVRRLIS